MNLICETILDLYTYKNRTFLCQIKVNPKSKFKNTCRWLSQEQWMTFDKELAKLLSANDYWNDKKGFKFNIKPCIEVKVRKSRLSLTHFYQCLGTIGHCNKGDKADTIASNLVLECLIGYRQEVPSSSPTESQEYEPQIKTIPDNLLCSPLPYEPYTPSNNILRTNNDDIIKTSAIDILEYTEDTYTPKPLFDVGVVETLSSEGIPKYTPAPIIAKRSSKENCSLNYSNAIIIETDVASNKHNSFGTELNKKSKRIQCEYIPKSQEVSKVDVPFGTELNKKSKRIQCEYIPKSQEVSKVDVPIYIPTPIDETTCLKAFKTDNIRKNKKRSNTIDVFPDRLDEITKEKQTSKIVQPETIEVQRHCCNEKLKKRSMSIDEIAVPIADAPVYIPTPIVGTTSQNVHEPRSCRKSIKRLNSTDVVPELFDANIKEIYNSDKEQMGSKEKYDHCKNKILKKHSISIDEIPAALAEPIDKLKSHKYIEMKNTKNEICYKMSSSSSESESSAAFAINSERLPNIQIIGSDNKFEGDTKQLNGHLFIAAESEIQKILKSYNYGINVKGFNTIDAFPELLEAHIKEKRTSKKEQMDSKEKRTSKKEAMDSKEKQRTISINEISDALAETKNKMKSNKSKSKSSSSGSAFDINSKKPPKIQAIASGNKGKGDIKQLMVCLFGGDTAPEKEIRRYRNMEDSCTIANKSLRESKRPPNKPKRLIELQLNISNKNCYKKHKSLPKNKELFGSDDDDDDNDCFDNNNIGCSDSDNNNNKIPISLGNGLNKKSAQCNPASSVANKKRKRDKITESDREKRGITTFLSKVKSSKVESITTSTKLQKSDDDTETCSKSMSPMPTTLELHSKKKKENGKD